MRYKLYRYMYTRHTKRYMLNSNLTPLHRAQAQGSGHREAGQRQQSSRAVTTEQPAGTKKELKGSGHTGQRPQGRNRRLIEQQGSGHTEQQAAAKQGSRHRAAGQRPQDSRGEVTGAAEQRKRATGQRAQDSGDRVAAIWGRGRTAHKRSTAAATGDRPQGSGGQRRAAAGSGGQRP